MDSRFQPTFRPEGPDDFTLQFSPLARAGYGALFTVLGGAFVFISWLIFKNERAPSLLPAIALLVLGLLIMAAGWLSILRSRLEKRGDRLTLRDALRERTLLESEIQGFSVMPKGQVLLRAKPGSGKRNMVVSPGFQGFAKFKDWAERALVNEDAVQGASEDETALRALATPAGTDGAAEYARIKKLWRAVSAASFLLAFGSFLLPVLYPVQSILALGLAPLALIALMGRYRGIVRLDGVARSGAPKAGQPLFILFVMMGIHGLSDFRLVGYARILPAALLFGLVVAGGLWLACSPAVRPRARAFLFFAAGALFYAFGAATAANCLLDTSAPERFQAQVLGQRVSRGRHTSYYLTLSPWGPKARSSDESVGAAFYQATRVGDSVGIDLRPGALGSPWYLLLARVR